MVIKFRVTFLGRPFHVQIFFFFQKMFILVLTLWTKWKAVLWCDL